MNNISRRQTHITLTVGNQQIPTTGCRPPTPPSSTRGKACRNHCERGNYAHPPHWVRLAIQPNHIQFRTWSVLAAELTQGRPLINSVLRFWQSSSPFLTQVSVVEVDVPGLHRHPQVYFSLGGGGGRLAVLGHPLLDPRHLTREKSIQHLGLYSGEF